ncbi:MAG: LysR family transcriptional regulator [Clostridia bacterium]|nr:LysR family transcriptional regulator [Clostridia bacterium]
MNVTMQVLRAFKAAAETGSFTHAAEKTYMTQPAFSRLIASLEAELGVKLFERTTRRVVLTAEGESCLWRINQILDTYDLMLSDIERMKHSRAGNLAMGYNPVSGPPEFIVRALKRLGEEYPNIRVSLVRAYSNELVEMVGDGRLDCALVSSAYFTDTSGMEIKPLQPIHLYALVSRDNGLAAVEELSARHLKGVPLVFMSNTAPRTRKTVLHEFEKQGIPLTEDPAVEDLEEMVMRVRIGRVAGITSFCDPNHQYPDIVAKRIAEFGETSSKHARVLAWRKENGNLSIRALNEILEKEAETKSENGLFPFD